MLICRLLEEFLGPVFKGISIRERVEFPARLFQGRGSTRAAAAVPALLAAPAGLRGPGPTRESRRGAQGCAPGS